MKYIFTIHSHITFLSALAVIEYEALVKENVILICTNYLAPLHSKSKIKTVKSFDELERSYNLFERISNFNYGKGCDRFIDKLTENDNYIAYIDIMSVFNRFLVTHGNCEQFNFIEEGSVNYGDHDNFRMLTIDLDKFSWRISFKNNFKEILFSLYRIIRGRSLRILNLPIQPNSYAFFKGVNFYGFSKYSFPNIPKYKKRITPFNLVPNDIIQKNKTDFNYDNSFFWIGDASCSFFDISMQHFENALIQLFKQIKTSNSDKIYIKYRGKQSAKEREITEAICKKNKFSVIVMKEDVILEDIFLNSKNLMVLGNNSSLLIYAKIMGHKVHSIFPFIPNIYNIPFATNFKAVHKLLNM